MPKYLVPINFFGTIEAKNSEEAWQKVYDGLSDSCGEFETAMTKIGMTKTEHLHEEPEKD
jgi:hypothetical protein